ncbi:uncharacterized protein LOC129758313 [Uranotaenia lowii]|uniref:uncharacterized protein LOC129758313 n=1 Tax=Uranotaenia lowii TaxID=190385 RepID=UPI002479A076|nr:uncharacterized protein LOC129758313 [Uranotaenia lowii]
MDFIDIQAVESKLTDITVTPIPMGTKIAPSSQGLIVSTTCHPSQQQQPQNLSTTSSNASSSALVTPVTNLNQFPNNGSNLTKYAQLLMVIEEMGRDIRPTYSGSRSSAERLKRGIVHARILVRECLLETERSARQ